MSTAQTDLHQENKKAAATGITLPRVVRAELIKLCSLRSTTYALVTAALSILGLATMTAVGIVAGQVSDSSPANTPADPTGGALTGVGIAFFVVLTLGVLAVTGEYASATIKSTLTAVPSRSRIVVGKALAVASLTLPVTVASTLIAFLLAQAVLGSADIALSFSEPAVARAVVGASLYLTGLAVLGTGFGWLLRSTAGALATAFAVLVVVPTLGLLLPRQIEERVLPYLPDSAGQAIMATTASSGQLGPWTGFTVFIAWIVATLMGASFLVRHRDA